MRNVIHVWNVCVLEFLRKHEQIFMYFNFDRSFRTQSRYRKMEILTETEIENVVRGNKEIGEKCLKGLRLLPPPVSWRRNDMHLRYGRSCEKGAKYFI